MTPDEIRALREARGWTQKQLADYCGVHVQTVKKWEGGITALSGPSAKLLELLHTTGYERR